ncbi:CorA family divalent cation transporter [Clostridium butyricum]|uniref:CorA family divalent cation transporter n=1 Tax=Clostridium butyricum TaxID=1492 RepID=UPI00346610C1
MFTLVKEKIKIKEYCSKIYYPFCFSVDDYDEIIKKYSESNRWNQLIQEDIQKRRNELLPDVASYLFTECNTYKFNNIGIFKLKDTEELVNDLSEEYEILYNFKKLKLIDGNNTINFEIENVEIFVFGDGVGILTFNVNLKNETSNITSPGRILNFNKIFKVDSRGINNITLNKNDGSIRTISLNKVVDTILSDQISKVSKSFYEKGFVNFRYVKFENYENSEEFKNSTFGFLYYLMNMFNESDSVEIPDEFQHSHIYMPQGNIAHFFSLKGGGVFVYDNGAKFINSTFKDNIMQNYSIGVLLALHQRISMLKLSKELTEAFLNTETKNNKKKNKVMLFKAEKILDKFRNFTAKCWFREFSNIEGRNNFFKAWQKSFYLDEIFQEMRSKIQDINEYLRFLDYQQAEKSRDNQNYIMSVITLIFIPLNFFVGFMGMNIKSLKIEELDIIPTLIYLIVIILICWGIVGVVWAIKKIKDFLLNRINDWRL